MIPKVLVVDDEFVWQEILRTTLEMAGYEVYIASDYSQAAALIDNVGFHLAIVDIRLSSSNASFSGIDLLNHIAELKLELPYCIILTGYPTVNLARESFKNYRVWDFVTKIDFDAYTFLKIVSESTAQALEKDRSGEIEERWKLFKRAIKELSSQTAKKAIMGLISYVLFKLRLPEKNISLNRHKRFFYTQIDLSPLLSDIGFHHPTLLIALHGSKLIGQDIEELHNLLTTIATHRRIILFIADEEQIKESFFLIEKFELAYSYDVVIINYQNLRRTIIEENPQGSFRRLVLSQLTLTSISPFVVNGPAPENMFFGREHELREITECIKSTNFALIGGRLIGKTSILKRLEQVRLSTSGFRALYHDCSFTPTQSELVKALLSNKLWFPNKLIDLPTSFTQVVYHLPEDKPIVILLDEADKLVTPDYKAGYPLFSAFRALSNSDRCRFVLSGERSLRNELMNPESPLYNFANELLIKRLNFHDVEELITRPMRHLEIELDDELEIVGRIWYFTSGHPNIVQRFCQHVMVRLNQRKSRTVTIDDIEAVVSDPEFLRKDFLNIYWEKATTLERLCTLIMAANTNARNLTDIHKALIQYGLEVTLNQVDDALELLVDLRNILHRNVDGYEFGVKAFPEVISKTARLDDLIALNRETYQLYGDVEPYSKRV